MSANELEAFLAAMDVVRCVNAAAIAVAQTLSDEIEDRDHRLDLGASPTIH
jgi:hypothetical protein